MRAYLTYDDYHKTPTVLWVYIILFVYNILIICESLQPTRYEDKLTTMFLN